ncbi:MAG TPA: branched-chain amino acid ABC transporter permease [Anaerolineales bacterium]|nr:branched-chain amino acid ABC transporter permease [Anaerolineales bacterium]
MKRWLHPGFWLVFVLVVILGLWPIFLKDAATREVGFTILLAITMAVSLNIIMGYTGYVSFGHVVFYGLGGYVGMYLLNSMDASLPFAVLGGGAAAGLLAFLLGKAILRLRGAYFALVTIGVNEAMRTFISNFKPFGGPTGIELQFSIYKPYGGPAQALWLTYYAVAAISIFAVVFSYFVKSSKFGLGLMSIREDEDAAEVLGIVTPNVKTMAFVLSAILPGMLGVLFFFKNGNVEPRDAFRLGFSIESLVMIMLGGQGTLLGPVIGALGYQRLRGLLLTSNLMLGSWALKDFQLVISGILMLLIILFIPSGLIGWLKQRIPALRRVLL